jgi:lysylphosphatidylglycerol synthetase-like protein (DUF2156 family)
MAWPPGNGPTAAPVGTPGEPDDARPDPGTWTHTGPGLAGADWPLDRGTDGDASLVIDIPIGRRVMVLGDLLLAPTATASSTALAGDVAEILAQWDGPGVVIVCGNLFAAGPEGWPLSAGPVRRALDSHPALLAAIGAFTGRPDCRLVVLPGWRDPEIGTDPELRAALCQLGLEVAPAVDLDLTTAAGVRRVRVAAGRPATGPRALTDAAPADERVWLAGLDRLEDPSISSRFVTSRLLYRRLRRYVWVPPLLAFVVALVVRLTVVFHGLDRLVHRERGARRVLIHAYQASWPHRLLFTLAVVVVFELILGVVVALVSRRVWRQQVGAEGDSGRRHEAGTGIGALSLGGADALDAGRQLVGEGATGLIVGGGLGAELNHLDSGFYASPGGTTELVREHPGRFGLPPVFLHHRQSSWLELETGADLHVRLLLADVDLPSSTMFERLVTGYRVVKGYKRAADLHPALVASWPRGGPWPPAPEVAADRSRVRRVRRLAAFAIFAAGLLDLLLAVSPPLRSHLHLVEDLLPLGVAQAAGALVALAGVALMMLARGVLRGQRRAWAVSVGLLSATLVLHLVHGADLGGAVLTGAVLVLLLVERSRFGATADQGSLRSAVSVLVAGAVVAVVAASVAAEVSTRVGHQTLPGFGEVLVAMAERLAGIRTVALPDQIADFVNPSLLAVGVALAVIATYLATRPVVDRRLSTMRATAARRAAELRARDLVRRHGTGTLDYFALRDDKQWFFHRDSLVAYAVYGGVCLVSPDPIGPVSERGHVWDAFRSFADRNGWGLAVMAAAEEWLPVYRESGMRNVYIGDEAVVEVQKFSLAGGKMKGLRQACSRVERRGYTVRFLDPAHMDPADAGALVDLMAKNRRGEHERGFSMMLGRMFDPRDTGLLLTVVDGPDGLPAAMCQFVPSQAISGFSLDLMRRDPGEHPNGLLDYALCSTIEHLRTRGERGLSLNFAAMRSILEGETGDGVTQRVERWALRRMSGVLQIETLWRFNAKYEPAWLPRYVVFDSAEQFVPAIVTILRAESLTEVPVVGRLLTPGTSRRTGPVVPEELVSAAGGPGRPGSA